MHEELVIFLNTKVSNAAALVEKKEAGDPVVYVDSKSILKVCQALKEEPQYQFNVLQVITGCDYPPDTIEVSYVLASYIHNLELILKVKLPRSEPKIESVCSLWSAANFQERECYDMVGVEFTNHPDHRRILCPEDWEGFPLRKDYVAAKFYRGMEIYPVDKMNFPEREFAEKQKRAERAAKAQSSAAGGSPEGQEGAESGEETTQDVSE